MIKNIGTDDPLRSIPGFGPASIRDLHLLRIFIVADLVGKNPENLYLQLERKEGVHVDRCVLYGLREAVYFAEGGRDPQKLKWWNWKDKNSQLRKNHTCEAQLKH